ncbi:MAG: zf-HC2 domain-containing protein [Actinobacteria bacterium]|nr:zf-HC2 domain-containing protein [Actinomycetota bacterium]MBO0786824.1 zf-HC2 domain-containing protein [Actinomycetota bacterium]
MTARDECRDIRQALGVYVIGAIEPAERAQVDEHLAACPECREELTGLAGLPAFLHRVPVAEAQRLAADEGGDVLPMPPAKVLDSLLARTARVRRARRWRTITAAAAAVAVAAGGGVAGALAAGSGGGTVMAEHGWHTVSGTGPQTTAAVTVKYATRDWGTGMMVHVRGIQPGTVCQLRVIDAAGHATVAASWQVPYHDASIWYDASSSVPEGSVRSFQVTSGGKVLASVDARE